MKFNHFLFLLTLLLSSTFGKANDYNPPGLKGLKHQTSNDILGLDLEDLFEQSELFEEGSLLFSSQYLLWSTMGSRPDRTEMLIPPVGLQIERQVFRNFGVRLGVNLHVWEEEKILATSPAQDFFETFEYRYWTISAGVKWHFSIDEKWDPYFGVDTNFRRGRGFCDCEDNSGSTFSVDPFIGTRYFLSKHFFASLEFGRTGVGFIAAGFGIKLK